MSTSEFEKYCRVIDAEGYKGTVMYYGPVAVKNKEEMWLGVAWDQPNRGKNDGSCFDDNGVQHRYFECTPGSGSFIKPSKVNKGLSLLDALQLRYVKHDAPTVTDESGNMSETFVMTSKGKQKSIQFVGEMKIRKWQQIDVVKKMLLRDERISDIGENISDYIGHVTEIDLQDNLLYRWTHITSMTAQLPLLEKLHLHGNKFEPLTNEIYDNLPIMQNLRFLALNSCNIKSWSTVENLGRLLPNIEELYVAANDLGDIPISERSYTFDNSVFSKLKILDMCGCGIESWSQVMYLGNILSLQELLLDGNPITSVFSNSMNNFVNLQRISLSATRLESWQSIDAISTYSSIRQLRLSQIPLFSGKGASEVRPKVIARIKLLNFFNGSSVSVRERTDAEKSYLRSILREKESTKASVADIEKLHPRFQELNALYDGESIVPISKVNENLSLAADMISVIFVNMSFSSNGSHEPIIKKIPSSVTIARLRMMVKQLVGLDIKSQLLSVRMYKDSPPTLLDDDQSTLQYYGIIDGAEIFINEV